MGIIDTLFNIIGTLAVSALEGKTHAYERQGNEFERRSRSAAYSEKEREKYAEAAEKFKNFSDQANQNYDNMKDKYYEYKERDKNNDN